MNVATAALVSRAASWLRDASLGSKVVVVLGALGLALVALSLLPGPGPDGAWLRDFLMTVGSSLALFAPFYLITRSLDHHLDQVADETARQVEKVRTEAETKVEEVRTEAAEAREFFQGDVQALRADVDRQLGDLSERVKARLAVEATANKDAVAALRNQPTREAFWQAFIRAHRLGLISAGRPPRVNISKSSTLYASVDLDTSDDYVDEPLHLRIESSNGQVHDWIPWPDGIYAEEVLVEVGTALAKHTGEAFEPQAFLDGIADLLEAAMSHPERRPAIELCPPQWMVCTWGVIAYDKHTYGVNLHQLQTSDTISGHVTQKGWVDADSWEAAHSAALRLFPARLRDDPWGRPPGDHVPF